MTDIERNKIVKVLERFYSSPQANTMADMIQDESASPMDIRTFEDYCKYCETWGRESSYPKFLQWKQDMREEVVQDITLEAFSLLKGRECDSREVMSECRDLATNFEVIYGHFFEDSDKDYLSCIDEFIADNKDEILTWAID